MKQKPAAGISRLSLDNQFKHWQNVYKQSENMFGLEPSEPARKAAQRFKKEGKTKILELGGGQGRDTLFFARSGFQVYTLDYCEKGIESIVTKSKSLNLESSIKAVVHDVRQPLPFENEVFDACFSHMLCCMAITTSELQFLSGEIRRVLKPQGLNIYTVRHTGDPLYGTGKHHGEDLYEIAGGFIVHFFSKEKVKYLSKGYQIVSIVEFKEGVPPKKLFRVTLRKI
jgi:SAM-dependent methyltransferase